MKGKMSVKRFAADYAVVIIFVILSAVCIPLSGKPIVPILDEIITRLGRNSFLVLALIIPIFAGMGINFGMILGAMAGQIGMVFAVDWGIGGVQGLVFAALIGTPISILLGWICGSIMNRAKGREMVTGYILGFFITGVYMFIVLYMMGSVIPIRSANILLSRGYGIRNTLDLGASGLRMALDQLIPLKIGGIVIPVANFLLIGLLCIFIVWFRKTKLGQDMRAVGFDQPVAESMGIAVDRTRVIAIVISTVLACFGQIIFLQNIGNVNTYNAHDQTGLLAAAAILVGGASVTRATIPNVFVGVILLHLMFIVAPSAGQRLFGQATIGEYFRTFISYGVIALALVLYAWRRKVENDAAREGLRGGAVSGNGAVGGEIPGGDK